MLLGQVEQLRWALRLRMETPSPTPEAPGSSPDRAPLGQLLMAAEVAEILKTDTRYVYRHADSWPFTRRLSKGTLRFCPEGLRRWLDRTAKP